MRCHLRKLTGVAVTTTTESGDYHGHNSARNVSKFARKLKKKKWKGKCKGNGDESRR